MHTDTTPIEADRETIRTHNAANKANLLFKIKISNLDETKKIYRWLHL